MEFLEVSAGNQWYFAIGAMINPTSILLRGVHPIRSFPAAMQDFKLEFLPSSGMAEAVLHKGSLIHGVLHELSAPDMEILDEIETFYTKEYGTAQLYDGTKVENVYVYAIAEETRDKMLREAASDEKLPTERYLDVIVEGCRHHGVADHHISYLRSLKCTPRKNPEDFHKLNVPENLPLWTMDVVRAG